jgi:hypothetical protein
MSNNALKSLPPHVARELRRHIAPSAAAASTRQATAQLRLAEQQRNRFVLIGCTLFTMAAGSMPLILYYWIGGLNDADRPLTAPQVRRGAFQNSGSRDVGKDPDWDFPTGTHRLRAGYGNAEGTATGDARPLPAEFLAMAPSDLKKVEDKIEAFAKGRGKNN